MKFDSFFLLENAGWPALLIEEAGIIRRANQAAIDAFGSILEGEKSHLSALWSPENTLSAVQFLAQGERSSGPLQLKFQIKGGTVSTFTSYISQTTKDEQKYFVFQLFKEPAASIESGTAHKQKLDCALQLARSVALDFNNALTSILGHSTLLLSKADASHPWKSSLAEIEISTQT